MWNVILINIFSLLPPAVPKGSGFQKDFFYTGCEYFFSLICLENVEVKEGDFFSLIHFLYLIIWHNWLMTV